MKRSTSIFIGLLAVFLLSWLAMVFVPYIQLGRLLPDVDDTTHDQTPAAFNGLAEQGRVIYATNGCVYCHSQEVGSRADSADIDRGWGERRTVARDYLRDRQAYIGDSRLGGDLANVGTRHDKADWFYTHMYEPGVVSPGTICPPLRFLFTRGTILGQPSTQAIKVTGEDAPSKTEQVVPTHDAKALAAYLLSLKRSSYKLAEAPEEAAETPLISSLHGHESR